MTTLLIDGQRTWSMTRDENGHREYKVRHLVKADITDGPANVLQTAGLPLPGALWLIDDDVDLWAWCRFNAQVTVHSGYEEGEPAEFWIVEQVFSSKPPANNNRCTEDPVEDPLLEPQQVSGGFIKYQREGEFDKDGDPIVNSALEKIHGPQNEWDANRPTVRIGQNVAVLGIDLFARMVDTVNDAPLWGLPKRCIKLSNVTWEKKYYGNCEVYYTRTFEFDIAYRTNVLTGTVESDFDRTLLDEGTKALNGHWGRGGNEGVAWVLDTIAGKYPNRNVPAHFIRAIDRVGNPTKFILNGRGVPVGGETGTNNQPGENLIQYYPESDFTLLGIPLTF